MTQDNQPKPGENPTDPPRDPQTAPVADDVVDEVEEEAAAAKPPPENSPDAPEATYREALDGFDPHLRDAKALTLEGGVRIMRDLFPFQKPLFRADGNIPANIGRYRIAKNDDDTAALLFAFDPDDLKEPDLSIDSPPGRLDRIHVVQARKEESPAHWAYPAIVNHQHMLQERALTNFTLYQTSADVWRSDQVGYVLYPLEKPDEAKAGENGDQAEIEYAVWMFSDTENSGEFTDVKTQPPQTLLEAGLTLGAKLGQATRADAVKMIQTDFAKRVRREAIGSDPISTIEKVKNPIWQPARWMQKTQRYFRETKPAAIAMDALIGVVSIIDGPVGIVKGQMVSFANKLRDTYAENTKPLDVTDQLAKHKRTAPGFDALLRDVDPEGIKSFTLTDARTSEAVPQGEPLIEEIHEKFSQKRLLGAMVGSDGAIARIRQNGIVSLRHANGVKVDHAPDGQTTYVRFDPSAKVEDARGLRPREAALFANDRVLKMTGMGDQAEVEEISGHRFLQDIRGIQQAHDDKLAEIEAAKERKKAARDSGLRQEYTGDPKRPIRWRNRLKHAAAQALVEPVEPASATHPSSKIAATTEPTPVNDRGGPAPGKRAS